MVGPSVEDVQAEARRWITWAEGQYGADGLVAVLREVASRPLMGPIPEDLGAVVAASAEARGRASDALHRLAQRHRDAGTVADVAQLTGALVAWAQLGEAAKRVAASAQDGVGAARGRLRELDACHAILADHLGAEWTRVLEARIERQRGSGR